MEVTKADFSGYATKANLKCSDGRTIAPDAFKHQDQMRVPLVWQHVHNEPTNVLGHAILENRDDGVYCYGFFNDTEKGKSAKQLVQHGDVEALSIYANRLKEQAKTVLHGVIREVSLVLAGANPGARIDTVSIAHGDGVIVEVEDEAIISAGTELEHTESSEEEDQSGETAEDQSGETAEDEEENVEHAASDQGKTIQDVLDTFNEEQMTVLKYVVGKAAQGNTAAHSEDDLDPETVNEVFHSMTEEQQNVAYFVVSEALDEAEENGTAAHADTEDTHISADADDEEGKSMRHNVFENAGTESAAENHTISHDDFKKIMRHAKQIGSLREAVEEYAESHLAHGIEDIDILFPDAKAISSTPEFIARRQEWVNLVLSGTKHVPFSKIKTLTADLTYEDARAKGYIKGNFKKEEFFRVAKRTTEPQTIYKKQKLDRDDVVDITDFDVVAWLKGEMRLMLDEEIARAILLGDGRDVSDEDKIQEDHIRPIATDSELYVTKLWLNLDDADSSPAEVIDSLTRNRRHYRGSGNPVWFTSEGMLAEMLLIKDGFGRRLYPTIADLQAAMRVSAIVPVEVMDDPSNNIIGILVNLNDYTVGANQGGEVTLFDDFDIDYNQQKYLLETRLAGALTKAKSALVFIKTGATDTLVDPVPPTWDGANHSITVAATTGIDYKNQETGAVLDPATPFIVAEGEEVTVVAQAKSGYYLDSSVGDSWTYDYDRGRLTSTVL